MAPSTKRGLSALRADLPRIIPRGMPGARSLRARLGEFSYLLPPDCLRQSSLLLIEGGFPLRRGRADEGIGPYNRCGGFKMRVASGGIS